MRKTINSPCFRGAHQGPIHDERGKVAKGKSVQHTLAEEHFCAHKAGKQGSPDPFLLQISGARKTLGFSPGFGFFFEKKKCRSAFKDGRMKTRDSDSKRNQN